MYTLYYNHKDNLPWFILGLFVSFFTRVSFIIIQKNDVDIHHISMIFIELKIVKIGLLFSLINTH